jgi:hypothetical protein
MKKPLALAIAAAVTLGAVSPVLAQGVSQTVVVTCPSF